MRLNRIVTSAGLAATLVGAPVVSQAASAAGGPSRISSEVEGENLGGGFLLPLAVLVAVILGILLLGDDGDDAPVSP